MRRIGAAIMTLVLGFLGAAWGEDLFVATSGSDTNPGTEMKPFATLERARDAIRAVKIQDLSHGAPRDAKSKLARSAPPSVQNGLTVFVREGVYEVTSTFKLTEADSGTETAPVNRADLRLAPDSPCLRAGENGVDIGADYDY